MPEQRYAEGVVALDGRHSGDRALTRRARAPRSSAKSGVDKIRANSLKQTTRIMSICDDAGYQINTRARPSSGRHGVFRLRRSEQVGRARSTRRCPVRPPAAVGHPVSPHFYTTDEEVERFMAEVARLRKAA